MPNALKKLNSKDREIMSDLVSKGMSEKEVASKHNITASKLHEIRSNPIWKATERKMWEKLISQLLQERRVQECIR